MKLIDLVAKHKDSKFKSFDRIHTIAKKLLKQI